MRQENPTLVCQKSLIQTYLVGFVSDNEEYVFHCIVLYPVQLCVLGVAESSLSDSLSSCHISSSSSLGSLHLKVNTFFQWANMFLKKQLTLKFWSSLMGLCQKWTKVLVSGWTNHLISLFWFTWDNNTILCSGSPSVMKSQGCHGWLNDLGGRIPSHLHFTEAMEAFVTLLKSRLSAGGLILSHSPRPLESTVFTWKHKLYVTPILRFCETRGSQTCRVSHSSPVTLCMRTMT